jgi:hypothetical protein
MNPTLPSYTSGDTFKTVDVKVTENQAVRVAIHLRKRNHGWGKSPGFHQMKLPLRETGPDRCDPRECGQQNKG